jgi:hypothetical protein
MTEQENRQIARDSLFLLSDLRIEGGAEYRIKVRNLSAGGMMGEGPLTVRRGDRVSINIRNLGWVDGMVAWVQQPRFGVAFTKDIDPKLAREPLRAGEDITPRFIRDHWQNEPAPPPETLRKV